MKMNSHATTLTFESSHDVMFPMFHTDIAQRLLTMETLVKSIFSPPRRCTPEMWEVSHLILLYEQSQQHNFSVWSIKHAESTKTYRISVCINITMSAIMGIKKLINSGICISITNDISFSLSTGYWR